MIIGHTKERELLRHIAESEAPTQSFIFSGPDRIGKFLVAEEFANMLTGGSTVDIRSIEPEHDEKDGVIKEKMIPVEAVRELKVFLGSYPARGKFRVGIIRDAHRLSEGAQNALLKMLEDPVDSAVILLITHELGRILGTVRSRCQLISFEPVAEEAIASGMQALFPEGTSVEPFFFSLGRPGLPIEAARNPKVFEKKKTLLRQLFRLGALSASERIALSEQLGKNIPQAIELCEWYLLGAREQLRKGDDGAGIRKRLLFLDKMMLVLGHLKETQANGRLAFDALLLSFS